MNKHILILLSWLFLIWGSTAAWAQTTCSTPFKIENADEVLIKCSGEAKTLTATQSKGITGYRWYMEGLEDRTLGTTSKLDVLFEGNYIVTAKDSTGCILADSLWVYDFPMPAVNLGPDISTCSSSPIKLYDPNIDSTQYQFLWSTGATTASILVNTSNTYWVRITNQYRCSATDTIKVNVNPKPEVSLGNEKLICKGSSIQLTTAFLAQGTSPYTYSWSPSSSLSSSTAQNPVATPTEPTTYTLIVTDARGCGDTATVRVNVSDGLTASVAFNETTVCANNSVQLQASASGGTPFNSTAKYHYSWTPTSGLTGANTANPIAKPSATTTYTVTVRDSAGCSASASVKVNVLKMDLTLSPGKYVELCQPQDVQLGVAASGGTPGYNYRWEPAAMLDNANIANPIARLTAPGQTTFTVTVTDAIGCQSKDSILVKINPPGGIETSPKEHFVCQGQSVTLTAKPIDPTSTGYQYQWSPADSRLQNANTATPVFNAPLDFTGSLTFYVVATYGQDCKSNRDSVVVHVISAPQVELGNTDTVVCTGTEVMLRNQKNGTGAYEWMDLQTHQVISSEPTYTTAKPGSYSLRITNTSTGCTNADTITIVNPETLTHAAIEAEANSFNNKALPLKVLSDGTRLKYSWSSNGAGKFTNAGDTTNYLPAASDTGYIEIKVVVENPCGSLTATHEVYFEVPMSEEQLIFVPKFFSPYSEHPDNAALKVFTLNTTEEDFSFKVYDRWGGIVYQTKDFAEANRIGWNGTLHNTGAPLNAGNYTYAVQGKYRDGTIFTITGTTTLLR